MDDVIGVKYIIESAPIWADYTHDYGRNWFKRAQAWTEGDGDCMQSSANLMMRWKYGFMPGGKWDAGGEPFLVHALVHGRGQASGHRFPHAWVEVGEIVHDYSNGVERKLPKEIYYIIGGIDQSDPRSYRKYSFEEMRKKLLSESNYGPWDLDESLEEKPEKPRIMTKNPNKRNQKK
jgi:hypothetical protein